MPEYAKVNFGSVTVTALSRHGGTSAAPFDSLNLGKHVGDQADCVERNWQKVHDLTNAAGLTFLHAEHGTKVNLAAQYGLAPLGDGLVTTNIKHGIVALSADCVPFALVDPVNKVIAVGHAGWRGVLADLMSELSKTFVELGASILKSTAVIGPAICANCYEVPAERVSQFEQVNPAAIAGETHLDISAGVCSKLGELGYSINIISGCTFEDSNLFSYRRANGQPTGRQGLVVIIND
jgi:YfiH family protein